MRERPEVIYFLCGERETRTVTLLECPDFSTWRVINSFIVQLFIVPLDLQAGSGTPNLGEGDREGREAW